jgi:hypothetical protein
MTSQIKTIFDTFQQQALIIADEVHKAGYTGLGVQEETITDTLLNRIQYEHEENFTTRKFTKKEEGNISGADWLWCIGEPGAWITFAIQAKIVNINTGRVRYLHYHNGEQYSLLINFARQFHFIPKYTIYSKVDESIELFSRSVPELSKNPAELWSFAAISPLYTKHLLSPREKHISSVLQFAVPWAYAFGEEIYENTMIAKGIAGNFESVYWSLENEYRRRKNQKPVYSYKHINWENPQPLQLVSKSMPLPVLYLMTQNRFPHKIPIGNVSVFSRQPVLQSLEIELAKVEGSIQWKNFPRVFEHKVEKLQDSDRFFLLPDGKW